MVAHILRCNSWNCPICLPRRKRQVVALARSGEGTVFVTLTVNPSWGTSPDDRARSLADSWRIVVRLWKTRHKGLPLPYFCVFEATKNGEPHLHILCRTPWISQKWISTVMARLMDAPIVVVKKVRSQKKIAEYLSKYLGKNPHRFGKCKRYWVTQNWDISGYKKPAAPWHRGKRWDLCDQSIDQVAEGWRQEGLSVEVMKHGIKAKHHGPGEDELWMYNKIMKLREQGLPW